MLEKKHNSKAIRGKLRVCKYLNSHMELKHIVPHTKTLTLSNLKYMSGKYKSLYIKLDVGSMGIGVYKMSRLLNGYKLYSTQNKKQTHQHFITLSALYNHLKSKQQDKMIIQKAILLDRVNGRPYDIRVMVQRKPGGKWTCTGFLVKVGAPDRIVTNYYQGGTIYTLQKLLKLKGKTELQRNAIIKELTQTALLISKTLSKKRSGMHEMGIDFAYSRSQKLWVLEVNSNYPQFHPLKKINPIVYHRMLSYARSYGRVDG